MDEDQGFELDGLLARARQGDVGAHETLIKRYLPWMEKRARGMVAGAPDVLAQTGDLVQQALLGIISSPPRERFESESRFRAYLLKVLENSLKTMIASQRRLKRDRRLEVAIRTGLDLVEDKRRERSPSPPTASQRKEEGELMLRAMNRLPEQDRALVSMRSVEHLSWHVIAEKLGTTSDAARVRYGRVVERLGEIARGLHDEL